LSSPIDLIQELFTRQNLAADNLEGLGGHFAIYHKLTASLFRRVQDIIYWTITNTPYLNQFPYYISIRPLPIHTDKGDLQHT
jgi:hypothetical protein